MLLTEMENKIQKDFQKLMKQFPELENKIGNRMEQEETEIQVLLKYLYANMPFSDIADYSYDIIRSFSEHAIELKKHQLWQEKTAIPEDIFLDYVVFHRVNTEAISPCRSLFYHQLKDRIADKSMEEAILEVNYWCGEEATYQSTDNRTISAEAVYQSGIGRCGEESVFTVNALRSVGIPARQVYTHRWAHCDDNHAWVEVWCDGQWRFLGACEPEEVLDRGWFLNASSRAMMIHSRIYGNQSSDGQIIKKQDMTAEINRLAKYADTVELEIQVVDEKGQPVPEAMVYYQLLNYAELAIIAQQKTDEKGQAKLETGKGSLFISVVKNEKNINQIVDTSKELKIKLVLDQSDQKLDQWMDFNMYAPVDKPVLKGQLTSKQAEEGAAKFKQATQKRLLKMDGFYHQEGDFKARALTLAMGNYHEIEKFLNAKELNQENEKLKEALLEQLPNKDFRDCKASRLLEHLEWSQKYQDSVDWEIFKKYILNPRIGYEQASSYRKVINQYFSSSEIESFKQQPRAIWQWIFQHISEKPEREYKELLTTPVGCLNYRVANLKSKHILFVAIARSIGVPARLNPIDQRMQYYYNGEFVDVIEREPILGETENKAGIQIKSADQTKWIYMLNWTIAKQLEENHCWQTLDLGEGYQGETELTLDAGVYRVITTNRLPNGNQFAKMMEFAVTPKEVKEIRLSLREAELKDMLEEIQLNDFQLEKVDGEMIKASEIVSKKPALFIWLEVGKEPTEHILNEIFERHQEFMKLPVYFILSQESDLTDSTFAKLQKVLPEMNIYFDRDHHNINYLARRMYGDPDKLPLILIVNPEMKGIYSFSGYGVGTSNMILRMMQKDS